MFVEKSYIYIIVINKTFEQYIGQSINPKKRMLHHNHGDQLVDRKMKAHGFTYYVLDECDISQINQLEEYYVKLFNVEKSLGFGGLNLTGGGMCYDTQEVWSHDKRKRMAEKMKESWTDERRAEQSKKFAGKNNPMYQCDRPEEWRKQQSEKIKKKWIENGHPLQGSKRSEELKYKDVISQPNCKRVVQLDLLGNYIKTWESIHYAQKCLNISNIGGICNDGVSKFTSGGFLWLFEEDYDEQYVCNLLSRFKESATYKSVMKRCGYT